jgi:hypothetical protein
MVGTDLKIQKSPILLTKLNDYNEFEGLLQY